MSKLPIAGSIYPATVSGFQRLLAEANRVSGDGYELLSVVPLGEQIGAVFKRTHQSPADKDSFFE